MTLLVVVGVLASFGLILWSAIDWSDRAGGLRELDEKITARVRAFDLTLLSIRQLLGARREPQ